MQHVSIKVLATGLAQCDSIACRYIHECANHASAGDYRTENGFTPRLCQDANGKWQCLTIGTPAVPSECFGYEFPEGDYGLGAVNADGTVCSLWSEHRCVDRTFDEAISNAHVALGEAWRKIPLGPEQWQWLMQEKLRVCFGALNIISNRLKDTDAETSRNRG